MSLLQSQFYQLALQLFDHFNITITFTLTTIDHNYNYFSTIKVMITHIVFEEYYVNIFLNIGIFM